MTRRQPRAFISHAHSDHSARHAHTLCSAATAELLRARFRARGGSFEELSFGQAYEWGGVRLKMYPAGHCLGSAMLHVEADGPTRMYTGDFKWQPSLTAGAAEVVPCNVLVMECTFGNSAYRLPPREEVVCKLIELVQATLRGGRTPVIQAYALGKAQEVTAILTRAGIPVRQHRDVYELSRIYERFGVTLGDYAPMDDADLPGCALVVPPRRKRVALPAGRQVTTIGVSGWAAVPGTRRWLRADHALPLSDHADFDELLEMVERVEPSEVYCTHGPESFVDELRQRGVVAYPLEEARRVGMAGR